MDSRSTSVDVGKTVKEMGHDCMMEALGNVNDVKQAWYGGLLCYGASLETAHLDRHIDYFITSACRCRKLIPQLHLHWKEKNHIP